MDDGGTDGRNSQATQGANGKESTMAERAGFEPAEHLLGVHTLSKRAPSANSATSPRRSRILGGGAAGCQLGVAALIPWPVDVIDGCLVEASAPLLAQLGEVHTVLSASPP